MALNYLCKLAGCTFNVQPANLHYIFSHLKACHELCTELSGPKETPHLRLVIGCRGFNNGFHSLTGEFQSPDRKYIAHVNHATNANLMLFIVQGEPTFLQLAHVSFQVLIMLFVICTNNSQIIMEVICTSAVSNHLPHNLFIVAMFTQKSSY